MVGRPLNRRSFLEAGTAGLAMSLTGLTFANGARAGGISPAILGKIETGNLVVPAGLGARVLGGAGADVLGSLAKDTLQSYGLWPGKGDTPSAPRVTDHHRRETEQFRRAGLEVSDLYKGNPGRGEVENGVTLEKYFEDGFEFSEISKPGERYRTIGTAAHGDKLCSILREVGDVIAESLFMKALRMSNFTGEQLMVWAMPIHPMRLGVYDGRFVNHRRRVQYMTQCGGEVSWQCEGFGGSDPTIHATVVEPSGKLSMSLDIYTQGGPNKWVFSRKG